jgi:P2-related tail formation protein
MFWEYFKKLNFIFIEGIGAIPIVIKAGAKSLDKLALDFVWLRKQFFPEYCDEEFLPTHAKNRGVSAQRENETVSDYRVRVNNAQPAAKRGGRKRTVEEMMVGYGFENPDVINMRLEDPTKWAQFRVESDGGNITAQRLGNLLIEINELKPARSKLSGVRANTETENNLVFAGLVSVTNIITIECED